MSRHGRYRAGSRRASCGAPPRPPYQIEGAVDVDGRRPVHLGHLLGSAGRHHGWRHGRSRRGPLPSRPRGRGADGGPRPPDVSLLGRLATHPAGRTWRGQPAWASTSTAGSWTTSWRTASQPNLTLYHWDLPQTLQDAGGWSARETRIPVRGLRRAGLSASSTTGCDWWSTINEPWCVALLGHASGVHAPGIQDPRSAVRAIHHTLLGHGLAVQRHARHRPRPAAGHRAQPGARPCRPPKASPMPPSSDGHPADRRLPQPGVAGAAVRGPLPGGHGRADRSLRRPARRAGRPGDHQHAPRLAGHQLLQRHASWSRTARSTATPDRRWPTPASSASGMPDRPRRPSNARTCGWPITPDGLRALLVSVARALSHGAADDDHRERRRLRRPHRSDGAIDDERRIRYLAGAPEARGGCHGPGRAACWAT